MQGDQKRRWKFRRVWLFALPLLAGMVWFVWSAATYASSLRLYEVPTSSMAPTILPGDRICVEARRGTNPRRGELWVFTMPNGSIALKRAIGLPGESIEVRGGQVHINGMALAEPYLSGPIPYKMARTLLGPNEYFMLGDSRAASSDSHVWGPLDGRALIGRATNRVWPASRLGTVR